MLPNLLITGAVLSCVKTWAGFKETKSPDATYARHTSESLAHTADGYLLYTHGVSQHNLFNHVHGARHRDVTTVSSEPQQKKCGPGGMIRFGLECRGGVIDQHGDRHIE